MKKMLTSRLFLLFLTFIISGCGGGLPECGDPAATDLIKQIYVDNLSEGGELKSISVNQVLIENIETISKDDKLQKNHCKAIVKWKMSDDLVRIIQIINQPSKENGQALLVGSLQADPTMTTLMSLGGRTIGDKEQQMVKKNNYEMSLKDDTYNPVFQVLRININKLIESSSVTIEKNLINLSQAKTDYTIRLSEDKDSKKKFIVEAKYNTKSLEVIGALEAFVELEREGKKIIDEYSKKTSINSTAEQKNIQTSEKLEAPSAEPPQAPKAISSDATKSEENASFAPSFDCSKAGSGPERLICSNRELAKLDVELNQAYLKARESSSDRVKLKSDQLDWVKKSRNACSDVDCMARVYTERIAQLKH